MGKYALGIDIGSSAVKASLVDIDSRAVVSYATSPENTELPIDAPEPGWAEQAPEMWWEHTVRACRAVANRTPEEYSHTAVIGISYQEHGLVLLDKKGNVVRPAIIWCDSRTTETARHLIGAVGKERWFSETRNLPGNFTFSKIAWVLLHEPESYSASVCWLLPGDYIAYRLTGIAATTREGLSEGMFYSFSRSRAAVEMMRAAELDPSLMPEVIESYGLQGRILPRIAEELGLPGKVPVSFRAGDQHANAVGLGVLNPGDAACAAGTSGVIFGVTEMPVVDRESRVNSFLHVTASEMPDRYAVVLCINATGIVYAWLRKMLSAACGSQPEYETLNRLIAEGSSRSGEITVIPFGNGAERMLGNRTPGFAVYGIDLNRHTPFDVARAALVGIAFSFTYGNTILRDLGVTITSLRGGDAGLFRNRDFGTLLASSLGIPIEIYASDPAFGAAIGAAVGGGYFASADEATAGMQPMHVSETDTRIREGLGAAYEKWTSMLEQPCREE